MFQSVTTICIIIKQKAPHSEAFKGDRLCAYHFCTLGYFYGSNTLLKLVIFSMSPTNSTGGYTSEPDPPPATIV